MDTESLEQMRFRHRRELKDLQGRITNKKKNATKKTRKGVNDECAEMERQLRERQASEVATLNDSTPADETHSLDTDDQLSAETREPSTVHALEQKVEDKLEKATEKLHTSHTTQTAPQQGKKCNRQKERLARRAAEQKAAAQKAEDEASTMTDHRARESEYMKKMFATYDLVEKEIEPDGHCLFSAVADQLSLNGVSLGGSEGGTETPYKIVRRAAAAYMRENKDDFEPFLEEDLETYAARIRDTAEWGGQLELTALSRRYGVAIRVVQDERMERIGEGEEGEEGEEGRKTVWLAYYRHGYGLGEHYNSLRRKGGA